MALVIIDDVDRARIKQIVEQAVANPIPWTELQAAAMPDKTVIKLADRAPGYIPSRAANIILGTVRAAFSCEQQPAGTVGHLSISVNRKGMLPHEVVIAHIATEFNMTPWDRAWIEEFEPGEYAVNVVRLLSEADDVA
jgi:phenylalanyl-tRNA synthetase beta subunit